MISPCRRRCTTAKDCVYGASAPARPLWCRRRNGHRAIDQIVEMNLDRSDQIDQALHPSERSGSSAEDSGVGPAWSLSIHGILGPEPIRDRRRTGFVPAS